MARVRPRSNQNKQQKKENTMSAKNTKLNIEGETYVIPGDEDNPSEIRSPKDCDWNDFQTISSSDRGEAEYISPTKVDVKKFRAALKRAKKLHISENVFASALGKVA